MNDNTPTATDPVATVASIKGAIEARRKATETSKEVGLKTQERMLEYLQIVFDSTARLFAQLAEDTDLHVAELSYYDVSGILPRWPSIHGYITGNTSRYLIVSYDPIAGEYILTHYYQGPDATTEQKEKQNIRVSAHDLHATTVEIVTDILEGVSKRRR